MDWSCRATVGEAASALQWVRDNRVWAGPLVPFPYRGRRALCVVWGAPTDVDQGPALCQRWASMAADPSRRQGVRRVGGRLARGPPVHEDAAAHAVGVRRATAILRPDFVSYGAKEGYVATMTSFHAASDS